jgi:hypothetical protein
MEPVTIGMLATLGGSVLGAVAGESVKDLLARRQVGSGNTPDLRGSWDATWYDDSSGSEMEYVRDSVEITRQRGVRIEGRGDVAVLGRYALIGRFNSHGVVTLTYDFREKVNAIVGVLLLQVSPDLRGARGHWRGISRSGSVVGGRVEWIKKP